MSFSFVMQSNSSGRSGQPVVNGDKDHRSNKRSQGMINVLNNIDFISSNVQSSHLEALLCVFEDNEAVIRMIIKGRSPIMRHVSRTHRVALDWFFDRFNLDTKIQIKYIDTKNQLVHILSKGKFSRDEWNHLLCLFNISHFSFTVCSEAMAKRLQQDSGEVRVTAKSRLVMSLIARTSSKVSSSTSESAGKRSCGNQNPWSARTEREERSWQPVVDSDQKIASDYYHEQSIESSLSTRYSKWDDYQAWTSQEWKTDTSMCERSGQPVVIPQRGARPQQFIIGNDQTELELSVESRSFLNRVNDQVRKRQKRISNVAEDGEEHSMIWTMFMTVIMESAVFMGKNYQNNFHSIVNTTDLTFKHMFDMSTRMVSEQDEISGLETIDCENYSWKYLSLIGDERIINLQRTKVYVFSDSVLCLGKIHQNPSTRERAMDVRVPGVRKLRQMTERSNPLSTVTQVASQCTTTNNLLKVHTQHATQGGTMTNLGLLKSGKLINRWMIERGNPLSPLGQGHTSFNQVSLMRRPSPIDRGNPL